MMNVDNRDMDLGLALGTTSKCVQTRWIDSSGAGVNACSRLDMAFVASDPLTELVWSPQNGLTLKCAGSNLADKKLSLQWYVEPTNMVYSPSLSIRSRMCKDKKSISEGNTAHHVDGEVARSASLAKSRGRSAGPYFGSSCGHTAGGTIKESVEHYKEKDCCWENENNQICSSNKKDSRNKDETSEVFVGQVDQRTAELLPLLTNEPIHGKEETELFSEKFKEEGTGIGVGETEGIGKDCQRLGLDISLSAKNHTVEQFETLNISLQNVPSSQRRNRELSLVVKESKDIMNVDDCTCAPDLDKLEATAENDIKYLITRDACEPSEERAERGKSVQVEASSDNSRIRLYRKKGKMKEKYSSDIEVKERASKDMDESHGSMESCNSANLSSKGKRRWSFDQQFISKRIENQIHESPSSTSLVKQDSSFMNWISNMVKGIGKSNEEEARSLPSTTDFRNHEHDGGDQKISLCNKTRDAGSRKMGFDAIFQSLYCPLVKVKETRSTVENYVVAGSKELILADKLCNNNVTPILNNGCNQSAYGNVDGPSVPLKSKILSNVVCTEAKNGVSSYDSSSGQKKNASVRGNSFDPSAKGRPINTMGNTSKPPGSLWITRYSPKNPSSMSDIDPCHQKSVEGSKSLTDKVNLVGKELDNCTPNTESSICSRKVGVEKYKKTVIQKPSESLKSPEEMASFFARRLDALKHISSIAVKDDASHIRTKTNCLFCGKGGHMLQDCSEIAETELEGLLRNSSLYDAAEETPCFCIKCFQPYHWAAACPLSGKVQQGTHNKRCFRIFEAKEIQLNSDGICNKRHMVGIDHTSYMSRNPEAFSEKGVLNLDEVQKHFAPNTKDNKLTDKQLTPWCNIAVEQISEAPKGIYDAVRRLRLSRTDILKWMSGHISVSGMDGYFLRLRLGKWKEGLEGAGYYVACITGSPREKALKSLKSTIRVIVGGIECVVESKYVSNHDFEEDELMAWWQKCIGNGECPKEADLQFRLKERESLGF